MGLGKIRMELVKATNVIKDILGMTYELDFC